MGLHDRLKSTNGATATAIAPSATNGTPAGEPAADVPASHDPYSELKTRIHHACIATLGAELFKSQTTEDLSERVTRSVTEQLVLDRTPLTREERRKIIREITDDVLGYGPLEPFLRDDSSMRRPICETILSMMRSRCALSANAAGVRSIFPCRST